MSIKGNKYTYLTPLERIKLDYIDRDRGTTPASPALIGRKGWTRTTGTIDNGIKGDRRVKEMVVIV